MKAKRVIHHGFEVTAYPLDWKPGYYGVSVQKDGYCSDSQSYFYRADALGSGLETVEEKLEIPIQKRMNWASFTYIGIIFGPLALLIVLLLFRIAISIYIVFSNPP